jgi:hypothetical protein
MQSERTRSSKDKGNRRWSCKSEHIKLYYM